MTAPMSLPLNPSSGCRLVTADGRTLALQSTSLTISAKAGLARVVLQQQFSNPFHEPLRVTYSLPLPAEGAVSGFAFTIGDERVVGQVDTKQKARERFEEAILEGRTAAILEQERSSLFTQEVGNVPPLTGVQCEITVDQKLSWLADGQWEFRFPTVVAPRYLGGRNTVPDSTRVSVDVVEGELPVRMSLALTIRDAVSAAARPVSPSHSLHTERTSGATLVQFADGQGQALDRDVVVRWPVATPQVGLSLDVGPAMPSDAAGTGYGLVTLVPPAVAMTPVPRDLIILLDTSGSMSGEPLEQARRIVNALIESLDERDQLELIEFSNAPRSWQRGPVFATAAHRRDAQRWLASLRASSSTEMHTAMMAALAPLRSDAQRQVVLITDGLIGNEAAILSEIVNRLPANSRVHTVGIGSGVNRSLTSPAARAGRGTEITISTGESADLAAQRILLRTAQPLVTNLTLSGSALEAFAPARLPDLYAGSPALLSVKLKATGGTLRVDGQSASGPFVHELRVGGAETQTGTPALAALYARECVEDLELRRAAGEGSPVLDRQVETFGLAFQISTRLTSWVAVSAQTTVDPLAPKRQQTVPHQLAQGLSAEGVGLRAAAAPVMNAFGAVAAAPVVGAAAKMMKRMPAPRASTAGAPPPPARARAFDANADKADHAPMKEKAERAPAAPEPQFDEGQARAEEDAFDAPAEAESLQPQVAKGGLLQRVRGFFTPAQGGSGGAPAIPGTPSRVLPGRIVVNREGRLALEVAIEGMALEWQVPGEVRLMLASGAVMSVKVNTSLTTRSGTLSPGVSLTLTLDLPKAVSDVRSVMLNVGGEWLEIAVHD